MATQSLVHLAKRKRYANEIDPNGAGIEAAPNSQLGRVTYTARVDEFSVRERLAIGSVGSYYPKAQIQEQVFNLHYPDGLLQRSGKVQNFRTGGRVGFHPVVFSSMNALREDSSLPKHQIIENHRFAGIVQSDVKFMRGGKPASEFIAVTVGGSGWMHNNGTDQIMAGDEVYWDIPDKDAQGNATNFTPRRDDPRGKIPAVVVRKYRAEKHGPAAREWLTDTKVIPTLLNRDRRDEYSKIGPLFDCLVRLAALGRALSSEENGVPDFTRSDALVEDENFRTNLWKFLLGEGDQGAVNPTLYGGFLTELMASFAEHMNYVAGRKFARATSNAAPGKKIDLIFGTYRIA